ncbi:hypothetical protein, partial [Escherichia coli]
MSGTTRQRRKPVPLSGLLPLNPSQLARLQAATTELTPTQLAWVSGYFWG